MANAKKVNSKINITNITKREVKLRSPLDDLTLIFDQLSDKVFIATDDFTESEEDMVCYPREDFLDAVVALFPNHVAYSFPDDDE